MLVYKGACLIDANKRICKDDPLRNLSIHIYKNTKLYKIKNIEAKLNLIIQVIFRS